MVQRATELARVVMPAWKVDPNDLFEKFGKKNPPEFYGSEDPMYADEFIV